MIRDITIGRYYDSESVIHRMDPRTKLMGVLVYIISLFLVKNVWCGGLPKLDTGEKIMICYSL